MGKGSVVAAVLGAVALTGCISDGSSRWGRRSSGSATPSAAELEAQRKEARIAELEAAVRSMQSRFDDMGASVNQVATDSDSIRRATDARAADSLALRQDLDALSSRVVSLEAQLAQTRQSLMDSLSKEHKAIVDEVNKSLRESDARTDRAIRDAVAQASRSSGGRSQGSSSSGVTPPSGSYYEHIVQSGETLGAIAKAYKVSVDTIVKANKLKSANAIRAGQTLYIPAP